MAATADDMAIGRQHGKDYQLLYDSQSRRSHHTHTVDNDRNQQKGKIDQQILQRDRCSQQQHAPAKLSVQTDIATRKLKMETFSVQIPQGRSKAYPLRSDRGYGRSRRPQMAATHQYEIQHDVQRTSQRHEIERRARISQSA